MDLTIGSVALLTAGSTTVPATSLPVPAGSQVAASPQPQPALPQQPPLSAEAARHAAREINDFIKSSSANIEFTVDSESDRLVVRVVDSENNQLIRQIPSEEMLAISHALDRMTGLLFKQKA